MKSGDPIGNLVVTCFVIVVAVVLYFLPSLVASNRKHPQQGPILIVSLLLGWTLIGWVVALAWAAAGESGQRKGRCPHCKEIIIASANVCRYCGRDVAPLRTAAEKAHAVDPGPGI